MELESPRSCCCAQHNTRKVPFAASMGCWTAHRFPLEIRCQTTSTIAVHTIPSASAVFKPSTTGDGRVAVGLIRLYEVVIFGFASLPTTSDAARRRVVVLCVRCEPSGKLRMAIAW
jgi:hypothetical protein